MSYNFKNNILYKFGILGSGSWATALTKILTDNGQKVHWWVRNQDSLEYILQRRHNPHYLSAAYFNLGSLQLHHNVNDMVQESEVIVLAIPAAYIADVLATVDTALLKEKIFISAVKGIVPIKNLLLNDVLLQEFDIPISNYFAIMGPCHAEEVASEKLSYLTMAGIDIEKTKWLANCFVTPYIKMNISEDIIGVQYAAVLKNIYALGAGIAHGLDYGDNFLSVIMSNSANEMGGFLQTLRSYIEEKKGIQVSNTITPNYNASVYLGDLLVTCYSLYSRNRTFGTMIGKGYSVKAAQIEMNMVAEGYNAANCVHILNQQIGATMPIANTVYKILHTGLHPRVGFKELEQYLG